MAEHGSREPVTSGQERLQTVTQWNNQEQQAETHLMCTPRPLQGMCNNNLDSQCSVNTNTHTDTYHSHSRCQCSNNLCHEEKLKHENVMRHNRWKLMLIISVVTILVGGGIAALYISKNLGGQQFCVLCPKPGGATEMRCTCSKVTHKIIFDLCVDDIVRSKVKKAKEALVKQYVRSQPALPQKQIMHHVNSPVPRAHLQIRDNIKFVKDTKGLYNVTSWEPTVLANVTLSGGNGNKGTDGQLIIQQTGDYFVYSQIHFLKPRNFNITVPFVTNGLFRYRYEDHSGNVYNEELMRSSEVVPFLRTPNATDGRQRPARRYQHTGNIGGIFSLKKGDRIYVKVNNVDLILNRKESNYYGLFMVNKG